MQQGFITEAVVIRQNIHQVKINHRNEQQEASGQEKHEYFRQMPPFNMPEQKGHENQPGKQHKGRKDDFWPVLGPKSVKKQQHSKQKRLVHKYCIHPSGMCANKT